MPILLDDRNNEREMLDRDVFKRSLDAEYISKLKQGEEALLDVNLFQLMDAFKRIVEQRLPDAPIIFNAEKWTIKDKTIFIMEALKNESIIYFQDLFEEISTISEFIVTFLALLELVHRGMVMVFQPDPNKDIRLKAYFNDNEEGDNG